MGASLTSRSNQDVVAVTKGTAELATRCKNIYGLEVNTHTRPSLNRGDFLPRSSCPLAPPAAFLRSSLGQRSLTCAKQARRGSRFAARRCFRCRSIFYSEIREGCSYSRTTKYHACSPEPSTLATSLYHIGRTQRAHLHPRPFFPPRGETQPFRRMCGETCRFHFWKAGQSIRQAGPSCRFCCVGGSRGAKNPARTEYEKWA